MGNLPDVSPKAAMFQPARLCLLLLLLGLTFGLPARADEDMPPALQARIDAATADCKGFDNGTLTVPAQALSRPDLNGDGAPDWALDEGALQCSTAASLFCGSGGCSTAFVIDGTETEIFGRDWELVTTTFGPVLLSFTGGVDCGESNAAPCVRALVWGDGKWNTQPMAQ